MEDFDPKLLRSEPELEAELSVSVDMDCLFFRFCSSLLDAEEMGVSRKPSLVALLKAL